MLDYSMKQVYIQIYNGVHQIYYTAHCPIYTKRVVL